MAADSAPTLIRSSTRGSVANPTHAMAIGMSAAAIGAHDDATSSDPISHRTLRNVCVKSARYCTNEITADSTMCSVTPPSRQHERRRSAAARLR